VTAHSILLAFGSYGGAFVVALVSSFVPLVSVDLFLVGLVMSTSAFAAPAIVACAAAGTLAGKLPIYYATRGAVSLSEKARARIERLRARIARWERAPLAVLATSSLLGLPPFSLVATAAGVLAIRARDFCIVVFAGRALRFAAVIAIAAHVARARG